MDSSSCEICRKNAWKYKCPACTTKYCSVACYKSHKEGNCEPVASKEDGELSSSDNETPADSSGRNFCKDAEEEDRVPAKTLQQLGQSENVKSMLENPHLRDMLKSIYQSPNPEHKLGDALDIPIFSEFADECLKICMQSKQEEKST